MKKLVKIGMAAALLVLGLAGCGRPNLAVDHHHLNPDGLGVVIKGQSKHQSVSYQVDNGKKQTEKTHNGTFALTVPAKTTTQKVVFTAGGTKKAVTVGKAQSIITYPKLQQKYNQAITAMALSQSDRQKAVAMQKQAAALKQQQQQLVAKIAADKKKLAAGDTSAAADLKAQAAKGAQLKAQGKKLQATGASVQAAMKRAKSKVSDQLLPANGKPGVHNLVTTKDVTIRTNLDHNQVVGVALMVPVSAMKNKQQAKKFITSFSVLADSAGANAKKIMKDFQKQAKSSKTSQTTNKTLRSNGISFQIGYSATTLYIYMTKK